MKHKTRKRPSEESSRGRWKYPVEEGKVKVTRGKREDARR